MRPRNRDCNRSLDPHAPDDVDGHTCSGAEASVICTEKQEEAANPERDIHVLV